MHDLPCKLVFPILIDPVYLLGSIHIIDWARQDEEESWLLKP